MDLGAVDSKCFEDNGHRDWQEDQYCEEDEGEEVDGCQQIII